MTTAKEMGVTTMDPTQLVDEALRRFTVMHTAGSRPEPALVATFQHLAKLDGWAKIAIDRLVADPENARAAADLKLSMNQAVRLHPQFMRTLSEVCATSGVHPPKIPAPGQG